MNYKRECHNGNRFVFEHNGIKFYAGGRLTGAIFGYQFLHLDLDNNVGKGKAVHAIGFDSKAIDNLKHTAIQIDWKDMSVPQFGIETWKVILSEINRIKKPVLISCAGGHGRTGTALAILASMCKKIPKDKCPVQWIRDNYCKEAIETNEQVYYIEDVTGLKAHALGAKTYKKWQKEKDDFLTEENHNCKITKGNSTEYDSYFLKY